MSHIATNITLEKRLGTGLEILYEGGSVAVAGSSFIVAARKDGSENHCFSKQIQKPGITTITWTRLLLRIISKTSANIPRPISRRTTGKINQSSLSWTTRPTTNVWKA